MLREGLDIPEVSLVAILDADKEGFLRSETSMIQTIGRAARNADGRVIMYADTITKSMKSAIDETSRRREIQNRYNEERGIVPKTINKEIHQEISMLVSEKEETYSVKEVISRQELIEKIEVLKEQMLEAAENLNFEQAAIYRDSILQLEKKLNH